MAAARRRSEAVASSPETAAINASACIRSPPVSSASNRCTRSPAARRAAVRRASRSWAPSMRSRSPIAPQASAACSSAPSSSYVSAARRWSPPRASSPAARSSARRSISASGGWAQRTSSASAAARATVRSSSACALRGFRGGGSAASASPTRRAAVSSSPRAAGAIPPSLPSALNSAVSVSHERSRTRRPTRATRSRPPEMVSDGSSAGRESREPTPRSYHPPRTRALWTRLCRCSSGSRSGRLGSTCRASPPTCGGRRSAGSSSSASPPSIGWCRSSGSSRPSRASTTCSPAFGSSMPAAGRAPARRSC